MCLSQLRLRLPIPRVRPRHGRVLRRRTRGRLELHIVRLLVWLSTGSIAICIQGPFSDSCRRWRPVDLLLVRRLIMLGRSEDSSEKSRSRFFGGSWGRRRGVRLAYGSHSWTGSGSSWGWGSPRVRRILHKLFSLVAYVIVHRRSAF